VTAPARAPRWALHPLTTALVVLAVAILAGARAVTAAPGSDGARLGGLVAVLAAGAAAGYANSGST
jgi:hypothetical protein